MILLDKAGRILQLNEPARRALAAQDTPLAQRSITAWIPEGKLTIWQEWWQTCLQAKGDSHFLTLALQTSEQGLGLGHWEGKYDAEGEVMYLLLRFEQPVAAKPEHQDLLESRQRLSLVIKGGDIGFWDWDILTNQVVCNDRWYTMLGYTGAELSVKDSFWQELIHPEDIDHTQQTIERWLTGAIPFYFNVYRLKARDGQGYRWIQARGEIVNRDQAGQPIRAAGTHIDITEQKETELALRENEMRFRELLRNFPNGSINVLDRQYRYLFAEGQGLSKVGLSSEKMVGKSLRELFSVEQANHAIGHYEQVFSKGEPHEFELTLEPNVFHITATPLRRNGDRVESIVAVARDVTEQKRNAQALQDLNELLESKVEQRTQALRESNERLQRANDELASFSYSVSHDLRAPLRAITGFGHILLEEHSQELSPTARELLEFIVTNGDRMGKLIDDILSYSRLSRRERQPQPIDMTQLFQEVFTELTLPLSDHSQFEFELSPLTPALGDPTMIRQVVQNLLSNAIKYTRHNAKPRIVVRPIELPQGVGYMVQDNGVGFEQAYAEKIFRVFERLHKSREFEGTGVGMAIARRVISQHGGQIWAEGKKGAGATFYFTLPQPETSA